MMILDSGLLFWVTLYIQGGPESKPQPNYQKIVLNRTNACQWD